MTSGRLRLFGGPAGRVTLVMTALVAACLWFVLDSSRQHLQGRALAAAQDSAATLTLALQPVLAEDNLLGAETLITAMMQTGNFGGIALYSADGEILLEQSRREVQFGINGIPGWFRQLFPLEPPVAQAQVSRGWELADTLRVTADTTPAYRQLWQLARSILGLGLVALVLVYALLWQWAHRARRQVAALAGQPGRAAPPSQEPLVYPASGSFTPKDRKPQRGKEKREITEPVD
ncbi:LapD/MoxY N-terminal periplasmic domain-containing protein [Microbulbifer yueqingensis]|uniref:LapD/MoxY domain-containing protein n=1 Tax=Microbulbifer yueqingensis TaxID=658219 RepID=A0A1G8VM18_9GAMM|nr:LapD/MoxY N-terminal periplasmic domain-containing protein [Microbulbifer yueqingensis]SDJ66987.1 LapD/MoxY domain-containing protein [Microbulbifer yueqingensis]